MHHLRIPNLKYDLEKGSDGEGQCTGRHANVPEVLQGALRVRDEAVIFGSRTIRSRLTLSDTVLVMHDFSKVCPTRVKDGCAGLEDVEYEGTEEEDSERSYSAWLIDDIALK